MDIIKELTKIINKHKCECFFLDKEHLIVKHKLSMPEARENICNHIVFSEITGFLVLNNIEFEVTENHDIQIFQ